MTKARDDFPAERLNGRFIYEPDTGFLRWRRRDDMPSQWNSRYPGTVAGTVNGQGYIVVAIYGKLYAAHRVIWAMRTGSWPLDEIDHENTIRSNNWWTNLRPATHAQNLCNTRAHSNNTSGYKGVSWHSGMKAWEVRIRHAGTRIRLGYRDDPAAAYELYVAAAILYHGEFANHRKKEM